MHAGYRGARKESTDFVGLVVGVAAASFCIPVPAAVLMGVPVSVGRRGPDSRGEAGVDATPEVEILIPNLKKGVYVTGGAEVLNGDQILGNGQARAQETRGNRRSRVEYFRKWEPAARRA